MHVRGVPVRAHWTLLLILPYLAIVLSLQMEEVARVAGVGHVHLVLPPLVWGAILALGLFASVAVHEAAHSVLAVRYGGRVRSITLMLLGGVSHITRMPRRPRSEAFMALAGPATSLALGALLIGLYRVVSTPADVKMGFFYLGYMNLALGVFNLLPAFPMDGGRILRAVLASRMGAARATAVAAGVGRGAAILMGLLGLWSGNFLLLLIAVFVYFGAGAEESGERMREALEGLRVADLVPPAQRPPAVVRPDTRLEEVLPRMHEAGRLALVVTDLDDNPVGVVQATDLAGLSIDARAQLRVGDLVRGLGSRHIVAPWDASANDVLERAAEEGAAYVLVVDPTIEAHHGLIGLITAGDIQTALTLRLADAPGSAPSARRPITAPAPSPA